MISRRTVWSRVLVGLQFLALVLLVGSLALIFRSSAVDEEWALTSGSTRWTFTSSDGALQVSRLRRFAGTVRTFGMPGASGATREQFVGAEAGFGKGGWTYSRKLTVPTVVDPFVPFYAARPAPAYPATVPSVAGGGSRWQPLQAPMPTSYITGATVVFPYWLVTLASFILLYRPFIRLVFRYLPTGIHLNLQPEKYPRLEQEKAVVLGRGSGVSASVRG